MESCRRTLRFRLLRRPDRRVADGTRSQFESHRDSKAAPEFRSQFEKRSLLAQKDMPEQNSVTRNILPVFALPAHPNAQPAPCGRLVSKQKLFQVQQRIAQLPIPSPRSKRTHPSSLTAYISFRSGDHFLGGIGKKPAVELQERKEMGAYQGVLCFRSSWIVCGTKSP